MDNNAGLYFHIPFCKNKCPYCDFFSVKYNAECANLYAYKFDGEMKIYDCLCDAGYLCGGTPSIVESDLICRILSEARTAFTILPESEITIECNPSKNLYDDFKAYAKSGINRISLGMQSAVDSERFALGRAAGKK